jgi:hypothetical protein
MDAIPWLAVMLRPLSALLPVDFQYLGLWILLSSTLLAYFAARIAALSTPHWEQQAMAGMLAAMAPTLTQRIVHPALCGHVFIVASIALHLLPTHSPGAARRSLGTAFGLLVLGTATHPYFAVMTLALVVALPWRFHRELGPGYAVLLGAAMIGVALGELVLFGYLGSGIENSVHGFGEFSANLNTFWNGMGHSRLFHGLPSVWYQYEGYCYLGAGCFFLAAVVCGLLGAPQTRARIRSFPWRRGGWPLLVASLLAVFACASPVYYGKVELFKIPLYRHIEGVAQSFRSSGRFIWPLGYVINLALLTAALRGLRMQREAGSFVLFVAVCLQAYDIDPASAQWELKLMHRPVKTAEPWSLAERSFHHLVLYPAEIVSACDGPQGYRSRLVNELAYLAYRHGWTFNSGYSARIQQSASRYCEDLKHNIEHGQLDPDTIYLVWSRDIRTLKRAGAVCGRLDNENVCVLPRNEAFDRYLAAHPR